MIDRTVLQKVLHANGISSTASDEEIRSMLLSAKWHHDDVETALTVLRENTTTHETRVDTLHHVFKSDDRLKPETITSLLGIDMKVPISDAMAKEQAASSAYRKQIVSMFVAALLLAVMGVLGVMWLMQTGLFHASVTTYDCPYDCT